ncbi:MAG: DMT family transporter [Solirubrobacteraceae bacterium]
MSLARAQHRSSQGSLGVLLVGSGVVLLSLDSLLIRSLAQSLPTIDLLFWRGVGAAVGFSFITGLASRSDLRRARLAIGRAGLFVAGLNCIGNVLFVTAVTHTTVAHALLIIAAAPIATAILAQLILRERASQRTWAVSVVVALGVGLVFWAIPSSGDLVGDLAAVGGACLLSLNLVVLRRVRSVSMVPAFALGGLLTALFTAPFVNRFTLSPREAGLAVLLGVVVLPVSLSLVMRGPRYLHAPDVSLLMLLETVLGPVWVALVFHEVPDVRTVVSGSIIVGALAVHAQGGWARQSVVPIPSDHHQVPGDGPEANRN